MMESAQPRRWTVQNSAPGGGEITIAGWYFGGDGPVVLLHHANGMCGALWALVARHLSRTHTVFAIDARGHGDSQQLRVPDDYDWNFFVSDLLQVAQQILSETGQSQLLGVGSSFGGIVTAAAAAEQPDLFTQVVMFDPPIHQEKALLDFLGMDSTNIPVSERDGLVAQTLKRRSQWPTRAAARAAWQDKPLFASWQPLAFDLYLSEGMAQQQDGQVALKCQPQVEAHIFKSTGSLLVQDYAPRVQVPVYLVHAALGFFSAEWLQRVAQMFPRGQFSQMQGGHMLPLEVPELVAGFVQTQVAGL